MVSIYKHHTAQDRQNDFQLFLEQCKRAMNKANGYKMNINENEWSSTFSNGETWWERLKRTGELICADQCKKDNFIYIVDFIYDSHVYIEIS